jgi:hypothetical protein
VILRTRVAFTVERTHAAIEIRKIGRRRKISIATIVRRAFNQLAKLFEKVIQHDVLLRCIDKGNTRDARRLETSTSRDSRSSEPLEQPGSSMKCIVETQNEQ